MDAERLDALDRMIVEFDRALRTVFAPARGARPMPGADLPGGPLEEAHRELSAFVDRANGALGAEMFRLMVTPQTGFFAGFGVMARAAATVGITDNLKLAEYLWRALGVRTTSAASMWVRPGDYLYCRINVVDISSADRTEAFNRLAEWGANLWSGKAPTITFEV